MTATRTRLASIALLVTALGIASCAPPAGNGEAGDDAGDAPAESGEEPVAGGEVTLVHDKAFWEDFFAEVLALGEQELGLTLDQVAYSDTTSYQQVVQSSLPSSDAPDVMTWWSGYRLEDLATAGHLTEMSDFWDAQASAGNLSADLAAAFTHDDNIYAAPLHISYWPVFYNKQVFDAHGLEVPETWDDLVNVADTLVAADVTPFYATTDGRWPAFIWFEEFVAGTDPDFYDRLTDGEESYTDPLVVDALREWGEWLEAGYFSNLDLPLDDQMAAQFASGDIAMVLNGTWFNGSFQDAGLEPGTDYDAFILPNRNPELDENVVVFETGPLAIPTNASDPEAARRFVDWWVEPSTQQAWAEQLRDVPATPGAAAPDAALQSVVDAVDSGNYRLVERYWEASPPAIVEAAVDELSRFMLNPSQYEDVLESIEQIASQEWDARG
jgi:multiple sugar transport system substrate-binding protein